eukprot:5511589-Amphidinium_carterae.1
MVSTVFWRGSVGRMFVVRWEDGYCSLGVFIDVHFYNGKNKGTVHKVHSLGNLWGQPGGVRLES